MKVKNLNSSSLKTKEAIRTAFAEMVKEKQDLNKITVTELVRRANINRSTFYLHYNDIYDIINELEESIMSSILKKTPRSRNELFSYLEDLLNLIQQNEPLYRKILATDSPICFLRKIRHEIAAKITAIPDICQSQDPWFSMKVDIFVDGICEQVVYYFRGQRPYTYDEMKKGILACTRKVF